MRSSAVEHADGELVELLRRADEAAFRELVHRYDAGLRRMARWYVDDAIADDVVQDTWVTVIRGIDRFEGRSSLRTWVFGILINIARRRARREGRTVPFASAWGSHEPGGGTVDPTRLRHPDLGQGYWPHPPAWNRDPADAAESVETRRVVLRALRRLGPAQREVMTLRDLDGWSAPEVCELLGISDVNQRTLLHRARLAVRNALEEYLNA